MISLERYARLLARRDVRELFTTSIVGRLPIGMASLAIVLLVQKANGSFADAGALTGAYVAGLAGVSPLVGRWLDRAGPHNLLRATALAYPATLIALSVTLQHAAPVALSAVLAAAAGAAFPPITICVRSMLPQLVPDDDLVPTAYSLDTVVIETMFIGGPALVALFAAADAARSAIFVIAALAGLGAWQFAYAAPVRGYRPAAVARRRDLLGPWRLPGLRVLYAATLLYSAAFALFELAVIAVATARNAQAMAGLVLALASVGSAAGALAYGSHAWRIAPARQFTIAALLMAAGILLMAPITSPAWLALVSLLAGVPMATVISTQAVLLARLSPAPMRAESFTWGATCLLAGIGAGFACGGVLIEGRSPAVVFLAAALTTLMAAVLVGAGLRPARPAEAV